MPMSEDVLSFCRSLRKDAGRDDAWFDKIYNSLQVSGFPCQNLAEFVDSSPSCDVRVDDLPKDVEQRAFLHRFMKEAGDFASRCIRKRRKMAVVSVPESPAVRSAPVPYLVFRCRLPLSVLPTAEFPPC